MSSVDGTNHDISVTITGAEIADTFVFDNRFDDPAQVADFTSGDDVIEIGRNGFSSDLTLGILSSDSFVFGDTPTNSSAQFLYDSVAGVLRFDRDGDGEQAASIVAELGANTQLLRTDIAVVEGNSEDIISEARSAVSGSVCVHGKYS